MLLAVCFNGGEKINGRRLKRLKLRRLWTVRLLNAGGAAAPRLAGKRLTRRRSFLDATWCPIGTNFPKVRPHSRSSFFSKTNYVLSPRFLAKALEKVFLWRLVLAFQIQFNSVHLDSPISQITNLSRSALQSVHIDIPAPKPHIGPGKTPK